MSNVPKCKVYGIDLGTTYSCVSHIDKHGRPAIIRDHFANDDLTPSVVYFQDGANPQMAGESGVIVGQLAKDYASLEPERVVSLVKQHMHDRDWTVTIDGQVWEPMKISSLILQHLCARASESINETINDVVITVPAYFGPEERQLTLQAGEAAGLNVHNILTEPMAAILAYNVDEIEEEQNVLVYDLGGGTFDVTILTLGAKHAPQAGALATTGDHILGGCLWDEDLARHWAATIDEDLWENPQARAQLLLLAEKAKKSLSGLSSTDPRPARQTFQLDGESHLLTITLQEFDRLTESRLDRTMDLVQKALDFAEKKSPGFSIDQVLLVGGSTLMPQVKPRVKQFFGDSVKVTREQPNFAVAMGAAIFGARMELDQWLKAYIELETSRHTGSGNGPTELCDVDPELLQRGVEAASEVFDMDRDEIVGIAQNPVGFVDVSPCSFGVMHYSGSSGSDEKFVTNLVTAQQQMPASGTQRFSTRYENQLKVTIVCVQNERDLGPDDAPVPYDESERIGEAILVLDPGLDKGAPLEFKIEFTSTGLVKLYARDLTNGRECDATLISKGILSDEELIAARAQVQDAIAALPVE